MAEALPGGLRTVKDVLALSAAFLNAKGIATARLDAERLIGSVLGLDRLELYLHHDRPVTPAELDGIRPLLRRRADLEPVAYILGTVGFHHVVLKCDARALMPRSETETLVEVALANLPERGTLLDVGTGAGAIAVAVKHDRPDVRVTAVDLSPDALALARENADFVGVEITFIESDLLAAIAGQRFHVIAANLPYIPDGDPRTEPGVVRHEPHLALYGGEDGLDLVRRVVVDAPDCLEEGGLLVLEVSDQQASATRGLLEAAGYTEIAFHRDLAGIDRVVAARHVRPAHTVS